jgi:hypothetical protein
MAISGRIKVGWAISTSRNTPHSRGTTASVHCGAHMSQVAPQLRLSVPQFEKQLRISQDETHLKPSFSLA